MVVYKVYTKTNYADTWRDPDDIHIVDLCHKSSLDDALKVANDYIQEHFLKKDTFLCENLIGNYSATDFRSYGTTIYVDKIIID